MGWHCMGARASEATEALGPLVTMSSARQAAEQAIDRAKSDKTSTWESLALRMPDVESQKACDPQRQRRQRRDHTQSWAS